MYCPKLNISAKFKLHPSTIFSAEAIAILKVLKTIVARNLTDCIIFTDSQSVLAAIISYSPLNISSYFIYEIRKCLSEINFNVEFVWIPSHVGIDGNEHADLLAKEACSSGEYLNILLPINDFKSNIKQLLKTRHFYYLENHDQNKGLYYFENFYNKSLNTEEWPC